MKIAIIGTGGVGGYIGAKLLKAHSDLEVTFVARGAHLEAIRTQGLEVAEDDTRFVVHPHRATDDLSSIPPQDLILFAIKSYDLQETARGLKGAITPQTVLLPLLNGVDHDLVLKSLYPDAQLLAGAVYILSHIERPGTIKKSGPFFYLVFGDRDGASARYAWIERLFKEADLKSKVTDHILYETWKKYLFIAAFATITSYYRETIGAIMQKHGEEVEELLREIIALANAKGIPLGNEDYLRALKQAHNVPFDSKTSMQRDFAAHRPTELEALSGYIVHEAQKQGIDTPLMQRYYTALAQREKEQF